MGEIFIQGFFAFLLCWVTYSQLTFIGIFFNIKFIEKICGKCYTFWLTLILTFNLFSASLASFLFFIYDKFLNTGTKL